MLNFMYHYLSTVHCYYS